MTAGCRYRGQCDPLRCVIQFTESDVIASAAALPVIIRRQQQTPAGLRETDAAQTVADAADRLSTLFIDLPCECVHRRTYPDSS